MSRDVELPRGRIARKGLIDHNSDVCWDLKCDELVGGNRGDLSDGPN